MPSPPNFLTRLTTGAKPLLFSTRSSYKVRSMLFQYLCPLGILIAILDGLECGGAYMKLLQDNKKLHAEEFSNASPYVIMFGPDKCGATNKVRAISMTMI